MLRAICFCAPIVAIGCASDARPRQGTERPDASVSDPVDASPLDGNVELPGIIVDAGPDPTDASPPDGDTCAVAGHTSWSGTARRDNENGYPDHLDVMVTWALASSDGCVDTFEPAGSVRYGYAIPGALCDQSITPDTMQIGDADATLTIDRSTDPATYTAKGATTWTITFRCTYDDGTFEEHQFLGGGAWIDASGSVAGDLIEGEYRLEDDAERCGPAGIAPCTYAWSLHGG
jgi:hypothetical protein